MDSRPRKGPVAAASGLLAALVLFWSAGCGAATAPVAPPAPTTAPVPRIKVVTTTTVLADLTRNVGGNLLEVSSIVPPGADVHSFQTTPSHSIAIQEAKVIVSNGFGLDNFLNPLLASARQASAVHVVAAQGLEAGPVEEMELPGTEPAAGPENGHDYEAADPHFWLDPVLAVHYVERIRDALAQADPDHALTYAANADQYIQELGELDREVSQILSQVPPERRHLVTFHDAYGYFGRRYGWEVSAFVPSDASEVTPGAVVLVMGRIREEGIPAVFAEPQFNPGVLTEAARDTGTRVGIIRSLPDGLVPTYTDMMRSNALSLAENLR